MIEIDEIEMFSSFYSHIIAPWIFKDEDLNTYRGVVHQLYAQMMGWA